MSSTTTCGRCAAGPVLSSSVARRCHSTTSTTRCSRSPMVESNSSSSPSAPRASRRRSHFPPASAPARGVVGSIARPSITDTRGCSIVAPPNEPGAVVRSSPSDQGDSLLLRPRAASPWSPGSRREPSRSGLRELFGFFTDSGRAAGYTRAMDGRRPHVAGGHRRFVTHQQTSAEGMINQTGRGQRARPTEGEAR